MVFNGYQEKSIQESREIHNDTYFVYMYPWCTEENVCVYLQIFPCSVHREPGGSSISTAPTHTDVGLDFQMPLFNRNKGYLG